VAWVAALTGAPAGVIAIDGKTLRRSYQKKGAKAAIHMILAVAARQRLVLGQVKVAEKSNEIVAIPKLLDLLAIEGAIVTIDAMGCQRDIAMKIVDKKADYVKILEVPSCVRPPVCGAHQLWYNALQVLRTARFRCIWATAGSVWLWHPVCLFAVKEILN
jgi:Transposase DDE domain